MKIGRFFFTFFMFVFLSFATASYSQSSVYAEALGQANLRARDFVEATKVGEIYAGQLYPVIGRSSRFPWLLLGDELTGSPIGWVYQDLVELIGEITNVPYSELIVEFQNNGNFEVIITPTVEKTVVTGTVQGEINIRSGPSTLYPRLAVARVGERFEILATHAQYPWLKILVPGITGGTAWVSEGLLVIDGDLSSLPRETQFSYATPALTPTPQVVQFPEESKTRSIVLLQLGERVWQLFLEAGFDFQTKPVGALYFHDLETGGAIQFGGDIAFSGTSLTKIAILIELYRQLNSTPSHDLALLISNTMICSDNHATNELLRIIGSGDSTAGALNVTDTLNKLGVLSSFISAPYAIPGVEPPSTAQTLRTTADQVRNQPDLFNQATVDDLGQLLKGVYDCAANGTGILSEKFPGEIFSNECRSILHVMAANNVDSLLKSGVPQEIIVSHKHGWISDTHGNAAVFYTPGGDYVLVMMLYKPNRLDFIEESLPLFAEVSQEIYNHYNPARSLTKTRPSYIPPLSECNFANSPLLREIQLGNPEFPP